MQVPSIAINHAVSSRYLFSLSVNDGMPGNTEELPDDYFMLLSHKVYTLKEKNIPENLRGSNRQVHSLFHRRAIGREHCFLSLTQKGWDALKDRIREHWDARDQQDRGYLTWEEVERYVPFYLAQVESLTAKRLAQLSPAQVS